MTGRLARYEVELADGVRTTLLLTAEEARRRGAKPLEPKAKPAAKNKARTSAKSKGWGRLGRQRHSPA